jgi:hypothetical protein
VNIPNRENIDRWLFDWTEGNLSPSQEMQLEEFLVENPDLSIDADAWDAATVSSIPFAYENQASLKKRKKRVFAYWQFYALILLIGTGGTSLFFAFKTENQQIAAKTSNTSKSPMSKIAATSTINNDSQEPITIITPIANPERQNFYAAPSYQATLNKNNENINSSALSFSSEKENVSFDNNTITNTIEMASQPIIPIENIELTDKLDVSAVTIEPLIGTVEIIQSENEIIQSENESESEDKKLSRKKINMPSLKLNSSSALSKWVKKDLTNTNQKDRVYALSEKSNLDLNNSFVGNISQLKFQSMSTVRWIDIADQQKISQQISFDGYLREAKAGLGVISNYSNFSNGLIQDWNLNLIYAPKLAINRYLTIEPSMKYTFGKKVLNSSKVINNSTVEVETNQLETFSIDPNQAIGKNLWYRDLGAGLIINAGPIYFGGQVNNLLKHQDNLYSNDYTSIRRADRELTLVGGTDFNSKNGNFTFSPYIFHTIFGSQSSTYLGASIQLKSFLIGGSYQTNGSISGMIGLHKDRFSLLCQTSYASSSYTQSKSFIHQLTIRINSNISKKTRRYLYL